MIDEKNLENEEQTPKTKSTESANQTTEDTSIEEIAVEELVEDNIDAQSKSAHDDFDWSVSRKHALPYTESEIEAYLKQYESTLSAVMEGEIVAATVSAINSNDVVLDISYKSDGLLPVSEFRDFPDLKVGDKVDVYVEQQEDMRGQLILSRRKAKLLRAWESIVDSFENGTIIKGTVVSKTKGGLIVDTVRFGNIPSGFSN